MLRSVIAAIRGIPALIGRIRTEPVMLASLALVALQAFTEAEAAGLGGEDLLIYVAELVIGWFARELVVPTAKLEGSANFIQPPLQRPLGGE